jgi:hypothetical protein
MDVVDMDMEVDILNREESKGWSKDFLIKRL